MIPALFTSSSALSANQAFLGVVGNNLANSNTAGFKSQLLLFSNQFSQVLGNASQPSATTGGKNPIQLGMGVQVASTDTNLTEGTFQSTGNPMDMAIQGQGFFVLQDGNQTVYSRAGSFTVDPSGNLVDPSTGALVQRIGTVGEATPTSPGFQTSGNNNIKIPFGLTIPGSATQNIDFAGNLNANAVGPLAQVLTTGQAMTSGNVPANLSTSLDALDQTVLSPGSPTGYQAGDTIVIAGTLPDGTQVNSTYNPSGTPSQDTVGSLVDAINLAYQSGSITGATASLDSTGHIVLTANQTGASTAALSLTSSFPNTSGTVTNFSSFVQTVGGKAGDSASTTIPVFDSQGTSHAVTFTFTKQSTNSWNITASIPASDGTITGFGADNTVAGVTFGTDGTIQSIASLSTAEVLSTTNPMTSGGTPATQATALQDLDQHTPAATPYGANDSIDISGTDFNGAVVGPITLPAFDPTTGAPATVGDLLNSIDKAFGGAVATLDSSGNIVLTADHTGQSSLTLNIKDTSTNSGGSTTNFSNFIVAKPGTNGDNVISFKLNNLNGASQAITLNLGTPKGTDGVTQTGQANSVAATNQDGYSQGTLLSETVSADGTITGKFTNGKTMALAQVALASFTNAQGLQNAGNNFLTSTTASGLAIMQAPLSGSAGSIQSGGLEGSNVDVGTEFTNLIAAQRGYEVNAKAFSTANTIMQDTVDLIR